MTSSTPEGRRRRTCRRSGLPLMLLALLAGCAIERAPAPADPLMSDPSPDQATLRRNFDPSVCRYENCSVRAYPIYRIDPPAYGPPDVIRDYSTLTTDIPTFLIECPVVGLWACIVPPWVPTLYPGGSNYPPSCTVAPPLPR